MKNRHLVVSVWYLEGTGSEVALTKTGVCFSFQVSALQADIKSLKTNVTETTRNEQKALAECNTLREAVKNKSSLESSLHKKEKEIKQLELEV